MTRRGGGRINPIETLGFEVRVKNLTYRNQSLGLQKLNLGDICRRFYGISCPEGYPRGPCRYLVYTLRPEGVLIELRWETMHTQCV